jgi:uncharacterized radical SAM superfamily Fe-S cluster-containing enzyme
VEEVYLEKRSNIALKTIARDGIMVFLCSFTATLGVVGFQSHFTQIMNMITETKTLVPEGDAAIFTDEPGF